MKDNKRMFAVTKENESKQYKRKIDEKKEGKKIQKLFVTKTNDYEINSGNKDEKKSEINNDEYTIDLNFNREKPRNYEKYIDLPPLLDELKEMTENNYPLNLNIMNIKKESKYI